MLFLERVFPWVGRSIDCTWKCTLEPRLVIIMQVFTHDLLCSRSFCSGRGLRPVDAACHLGWWRLVWRQRVPDQQRALRLGWRRLLRGDVYLGEFLLGVRTERLPMSRSSSQRYVLYVFPCVLINLCCCHDQFHIVSFFAWLITLFSVFIFPSRSQ